MKLAIVLLNFRTNADLDICPAMTKEMFTIFYSQYIAMFMIPTFLCIFFLNKNISRVSNLPVSLKRCVDKSPLSELQYVCNVITEIAYVGDKAKRKFYCSMCCCKIYISLFCAKNGNVYHDLYVI